MAMEAIKRPFRAAFTFVKDYKKPIGLTVLAAATTGIIMVYRRVKPMIDEVRATLADAEERKEQSMAQMLNHRFEHNLRAAEITLRSFTVTMRAELVNLFNVDAIRARMQSAKGNGPRSAAELALWDELKVASFCRTIGSIYGVCLLNALLNVQLAIVSRYVLVDSDAPNGPMLKPNVAEQVNTLYLSFAEYANTRGIHLLADRLRPIVERVVARRTLTTQISAADLNDIFTEIRRDFEFITVEGMDRQVESPSHMFAPFLFPDADHTGVRIEEFPFVDNSPPSAAPPAAAADPNAPPAPQPPQNVPLICRIRAGEMVSETRAVIHSAAFARLVSSSLDAAFVLLRDDVKDCFKSRSPAAAVPSLSSSSSAAAVVVPDSGALTTAPFVNVFVRVGKSFTWLLPETSIEMSASPLFVTLSSLPSLKQFASVIFFPYMDGPKIIKALPPLPPGLASLAAAAGAGGAGNDLSSFPGFDDTRVPLGLPMPEGFPGGINNSNDAAAATALLQQFGSGSGRGEGIPPAAFNALLAASAGLPDVGPR